MGPRKRTYKVEKKKRWSIFDDVRWRAKRALRAYVQARPKRHRHAKHSEILPLTTKTRHFPSSPHLLATENVQELRRPRASGYLNETAKFKRCKKRHLTAYANAPRISPCCCHLRAYQLRQTPFRASSPGSPSYENMINTQNKNRKKRNEKSHCGSNWEDHFRQTRECNFEERSDEAIEASSVARRWDRAQRGSPRLSLIQYQETSENSCKVARFSFLFFSFFLASFQLFNPTLCQCVPSRFHCYFFIVALDESLGPSFFHNRWVLARAQL